MRGSALVTLVSMSHKRQSATSATIEDSPHCRMRQRHCAIRRRAAAILGVGLARSLWAVGIEASTMLSKRPAGCKPGTHFSQLRLMPHPLLVFTSTKVSSMCCAACQHCSAPSAEDRELAGTSATRIGLATDDALQKLVVASTQEKAVREVLQVHSRQSSELHHTTSNKRQRHRHC